MKLFLIRHGETVDNIAGVWAGVRDSQLTSHGVQQGSKLGKHLHFRGVTLTHVISSDLRRAVKTAQMVQEPQTGNVEHIILPILREQDFGSLEGRPWSQRLISPADGNVGIGKEERAFVEVESTDSMAQRMDQFLDTNLLPLILENQEKGHQLEVAIVSHGVVLGVLWKRLLLRLGRSSVILAPEVLALGGPVSLEHLGAWSNTGYLELILMKHPLSPTSLDPNPSVEGEVGQGLSTVIPSTGVNIPVSSGIAPVVSPVQNKTSSERIFLRNWAMTILAVNNTEHLTGLKRTGGGVGSAKYDESQKTIDRFFKKQERN